MATTAYTTNLGLALPVTGELSGTWGDTINDSITSLLDSAVAGTTTLSSDADVVLTDTSGAANTAREAIILWTAGGTNTRYITAPARSKAYIVINQSSGTQSIVLRGVGPTTGVTIVKGESAVCAWNGSDFVKVSNSYSSGAGTFTNLTVTGNTTLGDASTDTVTVNGYMGVGGAGTSSIGLLVNNTALTGTGQDGIQSTPTGTSAATTQVRAFASQPATAAAAFTCTSVYGFRALNTVLGAGSTITNQYGFYSDDQTNGTNNFGFRTTVSSGTNKWNIYASGTAQNYFAGNVGINTNAPGAKLDVSGTTSTAVIRLTQTTSASDTYSQLEFYDSPLSSTQSYVRTVREGSTIRSALTFATKDASTLSERLRIDSSGNLLLGTTTSPAGSKELVLGGDYIEGVVAIGNSGTAKTIALTNGTVQTVTLTGNCTFTMPTAVAGKSFTVILNTGAGSFTGTFTGVKWPNNTAPTITTTASRWDILSFISDGTNWYGNFAQAYQ